MNEFCTELRSLRKRIVSKTTEESEAVEVVIELIGTDLDKALKAIEICPSFRANISSNPLLLSHCLEIVKQWKDIGDQRQLVAAMKLIGYSITVIEDSKQLVNKIINIIESSSTTIDTALVCGATVAKLMIREADDINEKSQILNDLIDKWKNHSFIRLCIVEGILNCGEVSVLSVSDQGKFHLIEKIADITIKGCSTSSSHTFQYFQCLKIFSMRLKGLLTEMSNTPGDTGHSFKKYFSDDSKIVSKILILADSNWENPLKGVCDILTETLINLFDICNMMTPAEFENFCWTCLDTNLKKYTWKMKSMYPMVHITMSRLGISAVLERYPNLPSGLVQSLESNHLASTGTTLYRTILKEMDIKSWKIYFLPLIVSSLKCKNLLVQTNAKNHWLLPTLSILSGSGFALKEVLNKDNDPDSMSAFLQVLKNERRLGHVKILEDLELDAIEQGLNHKMVDVRIAAFSVLCHTKQRALPPTSRECKLILKSIQINLSIDSPAFRQVFLSDLTLLIVRCRDSLVFRHRREKMDEDAMGLLEFLDKLMNCLFQNCFPGANYQRLITCLDILHIIHGCFHNFEASGMNKGSGNGDPKDLMKFASEKNLLQFYKKKNFEVLLKCVLFYMSDVRERAELLLAHFTPNVDDIDEVSRKGFELICSSKFAECESGASLLKLVVDAWRQFGDIMISFPPKNAFENDVSQSKNLCHTLFSLYEKGLEKCSTNLIHYARNCPLHGYLTALRICLAKNQDTELSKNLDKVVICLQKSVKLMLGKLSPENSGGENVSFEEMSKAINAIIDEEDGNQIEISEDHQLILACAWLNLKECALLASDITFLYDIPPTELQKCGQIMVDILTKCRHKGAIEATNGALKDFSSRLLSSDNPDLRLIPEEMLDSALEEVGEASASITRRSAGLPMLIQKIVSSEQRGHTKQLLPKAVKTLVAITNMKLDRSSETHDSPQCHALHVLKSIIHDTTLAKDILQFVPTIVVACVQQFNSPLWSIRNASLQLFGALVPRIFGQKKVRDNDSAHNVMSLNEFCTRFNDMLPALLENLDSHPENNTIVNPSLVPLLSMFSRLANSGSGEQDVIEFVSNFKQSFFKHLGCRVIQVRKLSSRAYSAFTANDEISKEVLEIVTYLKAHKNLKTNEQHGLLLLIKELLNRYVLIGQISSLNPSIERTMISLWKEDLCPASRIVLVDILRLLKLNSEISLEKVKIGANFEPFMSLLQDMTGECVDIFADSNILGEDIAQVVTKVLTDLENGDVKNDVIVKANKKFQESNDYFKQNPEVAMEVLDLSTDDAIMRGNYGLTAKTSSMITSSIAFASMMIQNDFEMFFRDESPYLSKFVEFTENLAKLAKPDNVETSRLHAAMSLVRLVPAFNCRPVKHLPLLLQYGFVNICNLSFILLSDEDEQVRDVVTDFCNALGNEKPVKPLCTHLALRKLINFGLEHFQECLEWFEPILDLFYRPWTEFSIEKLKDSLIRQYLFESGEGLNVYSEPVSLNIAFYDSVNDWLNEENNVILLSKMNINVSQIIHNVEDILEELAGQDFQLLCFNLGWTQAGYLAIIRLYHCLLLLQKLPLSEKLRGIQKHIEMLKAYV